MNVSKYFGNKMPFAKIQEPKKKRNRMISIADNEIQ